VPKFHFNIFNDETVLDPEGVDLPDLEAAGRLATKSARELAAESARAGHLVLSHRIEVVDDSGAVLQVVHFGEGGGNSKLKPRASPSHGTNLRFP
jgi:hypothetical protein